MKNTICRLKKPIKTKFYEYLKYLSYKLLIFFINFKLRKNHLKKGPYPFNLQERTLLDRYLKEKLITIGLTIGEIYEHEK